MAFSQVWNRVLNEQVSGVLQVFCCDHRSDKFQVYLEATNAPVFFRENLSSVHIFSAIELRSTLMIGQVLHVAI